MANGAVLLKWRDRNWAEHGHYIYRSTTPMDINNLPSPIETLLPNEYEYIDYDVIADQTYYYRIGAFRNNDVSVSDEIEVIATPSDVDTFNIFQDGSEVATFQFNGNLDDLGNTYTLSESGDITFSDGFSTQKAFHSTSSNYLKTTMTNAMAISFWLKREIIEADIGSVIQFSNGAGASCVGFGSNGLDIGIVVNGSTGSSLTVYDTLELGKWYHVYADRTGNFWLNGRGYSSPIRSPAFYITNSNELIVGGRKLNNYYLPQRTDCHMSQLRIFDRVLTDEEISTLFDEFTRYNI